MNTIWFGQRLKICSLIFVHCSLLFGLPVSAQMYAPLPASETTPIHYDCLYRASLRVPLCRDIFPMLKRQIAAHFEWDTRQWAMPLYIEFDQSDRWQRVTLLCLHLRRSAP